MNWSLGFHARSGVLALDILARKAMLASDAPVRTSSEAEDLFLALVYARFDDRRLLSRRQRSRFL